MLCRFDFRSEERERPVGSLVGDAIGVVWRRKGKPIASTHRSLTLTYMGKSGRGSSQLLNDIRDD